MSASMLLLVVALAVGPAARAQPAPGLDAILQGLARNALPVVPFVEQRHSALLRAPLESAGELRYRAPDFLQKDVRKPNPERYTIEGDRVTIQRGAGGAPHTLSLQSQPVLWAIVEGIRATLRGDAAGLRRFYRVEVEGTGRAWTIALLPAGVQMGEFVRVIRMRGSADRLEAMEIEEASGDRVVTRFGDPR